MGDYGSGGRNVREGIGEQIVVCLLSAWFSLRLFYT